MEKIVHFSLFTKNQCMQYIMFLDVTKKIHDLNP